MRYPRVAARLFNTPLLAKPSYVRTVAHVLKDRLGGIDVEDGDLDMKPRDPYNNSLDENGILTIPIVGGLYHRGDSMDASSGMQSYTNLHNALVDAMDSREVKAILLDFDSPGGEATGCLSFAETVLKASEVKPIWGVASGGAYSAAYKIASSCRRLYAPQDAEVGSIGVVWLHMDYSRRLEAEGIAATFVYAGKHKVDGNHLQPLEESVRAEIQERIDQRYSQFVEFVASNRPMTEEEVRATEARDYLGSEAAELGLTDGVASYEDVRQMLADDIRKPVSVYRFNGKTHVIA